MPLLYSHWSWWQTRIFTNLLVSQKIWPVQNTETEEKKKKKKKKLLLELGSTSSQLPPIAEFQNLCPKHVWRWKKMHWCTFWAYNFTFFSLPSNKQWWSNTSNRKSECHGCWDLDPKIGWCCHKSRRLTRKINSSIGNSGKVWKFAWPSNRKLLSLIQLYL